VATYSTTTITLLRRPLGEADHLVVFLSADRGRIRATARGTRKPKSKLAAAVQPFVHADIMFATGRGMDRVAQVQVVDSFRELREDLRRLAHASYWTELVDRGEGQPADRVYALLQACLRLGAKAPDLVPVTAYFQLHLMRELGFEMTLAECPECGRDLASARAFWAPKAGGLVCSDCAAGPYRGTPVRAGVADCLRRLSVLRVSRLPAEALDGDDLLEAESSARAFVEYHMDVNPKSLSFLRQVERALR